MKHPTPSNSRILQAGALEELRTALSRRLPQRRPGETLLIGCWNLGTGSSGANRAAVYAGEIAARFDILIVSSLGRNSFIERVTSNLNEPPWSMVPKWTGQKGDVDLTVRHDRASLKAIRSVNLAKVLNQAPSFVIGPCGWAYKTASEDRTLQVAAITFLRESSERAFGHGSKLSRFLTKLQESSQGRELFLAANLYREQPTPLGVESAIERSGFEIPEVFRNYAREFPKKRKDLLALAFHKGSGHTCLSGKSGVLDPFEEVFRDDQKDVYAIDLASLAYKQWREEQISPHPVFWVEVDLSVPAPLPVDLTPAPPKAIVEWPEDLVQACARGDSILFAGAGLSAQAGLPVWQDYVRQLLQMARQEGIVPENVGPSLAISMEHGGADSVADSIALRAWSDPRSKNLILEHLAKVFKPAISSLPSAHQEVSHIPFSAVLTTNFDGLLDKAFAARMPKSSSGQEGQLFPEHAALIKEKLSRKDFFTLHLFGRADAPESVLLSTIQFGEFLSRNLGFSEALASAYVACPFLFLGCSLGGLEWYLERLRLIPSTIQHYALVDVTNKPGWETLADVLRMRYNVQVIPFECGPDGKRMVDALRSLRKSTVALIPSQQQVADAETVLPLSSVHLSNIGPFAALALEFRSQWTVLLGPNGVGKSTILRAIATTLAGQRASRHASLLNVKSSSGRIEVNTFRQTAVVTINRVAQSSGAPRYKVDPSPERPFELEGIPLIGFPALRAFRDASADPKIDVSRAASADDLLPLADGTIDNRLTDLKTWLMDLDYKIHTSKGERTKYAQLWKHFFDALGRLAYGLSLGPGTINRERREVFVKTADGDVPIESVSQGTSSLMCWVGTLLSRLFDVHGSAKGQGKWVKDPWNGPALVLIDEIDTHMHPRWQRQLADTLKDLFKGTQFIVTSHSPLLIAGLEPESIVVLSRNEENKVEVERLTEDGDIRGMRADQILASWLFGLTSTVAPKSEENLRLYARAVMNPDATKEDRANAAKLAAEFRIHPASPEESEEARKAAGLIREWMEERIASLDVDTRKNLLDEIDMQLLRARGGLRKER